MKPRVPRHLTDAERIAEVTRLARSEQAATRAVGDTAARHLHGAETTQPSRSLRR
jgi:hypothetical protein